MSQTTGGAWNIPPPPGTESTTEDDSTMDTTITSYVNDYRQNRPRDEVLQAKVSLDNNDDLNKNTYNKSPKSSKSRTTRSRSKSKDDTKPRDYYRRHKHKKSRGSSRDRRNRSDLHVRKHRYRSRTRSRSRSYNRSNSRRHHKEEKYNSRHFSSHRSHTKSPTRSKSRKYRSEYRSCRSSNSHDSDSNRKVTDNEKQKYGIEDDDDDDDEENTPTKENAFKNDGSFLELFKKMQEEQKTAEESAKNVNTIEVIEKTVVPPAFGKRRGGRVLKTGMVQKTQAISENDLSEPQDAWSVYMKEVKRYKEACCDDDSKTRPLVK